MFGRFTAASKVMKRLVVALLAFIVIGHLMNGVSSNPSCQWNGFEGCECNILGACDVHGNPKPDLDKKLTGYAPSGLEIFSQKQNLAYLCEGNTVAILYDCNLRIPLYAATVMTGDQLNAADYSRPGTNFRPSNDRSLHQHYQQHESDYVTSLDREACYNCNAPAGLWLDKQWYNSLNPNRQITGEFTNCSEVLPANQKKVGIHRGHLIAAAYGRGDPKRAAATFTFTNVVPQFARFNSGKWMQFERQIVKWGRDYCATTNAKMYIIVGAIPSTYPYNGAAIPRYFGCGGFSNYMDVSKFRINVPSAMWAAAYCTFQLQNPDGKWVEERRNYGGFWRENNPGKEPCDKDITTLLGKYAINLFPASKSSDMQ